MTHIKKRFDGRFGAYLDLKDSWIRPVEELAAARGLKSENFERIMVHAIRVQKNGDLYLKHQGLSEEDVKKIVLTPAELEVYGKMREAIEKPFPQVQETLKDLENRKIDKVQNYFPIQTDFEKSSELDVLERLADSLGTFSKARSDVEKGFLQERKGGEQRVKLNAMEVFRRHMDDVAYYLQMQRDLKMLASIVKEKPLFKDGKRANQTTYREAAGDLGTEIVLGWIDTMARKGGAEGQRRIAVIDALRRNFGIATLGYKLSSALVQPTALLDGAAFIGGKWSALGLHEVATNPAAREFLKKNFPEIRERGGDDPAFLDFSPNKWIAKQQARGMAPLMWMDLQTASAIAMGAYKKSLAGRGVQFDLGKVDAKGVEDAQLAVRRSQASAMFKDLPPALARGGLTGVPGARSLNRALFQFKTFVLNRWSLIRHDAVRYGLDGKPQKSAQILGYLAAATLAEAGIRDFSKDLEFKALAVLGLLPWSAEPEDEDDLIHRAAFEFLNNVPFVADAIGITRFGSSTIPSWNSVRRALQGAQSALAGKKPKTRRKGYIKVLEGILSVAGVPGARQAARLATLIVDAEESRDSRGSRGRNTRGSR